jgi:HSP20 family molecular chaperone IbpA
MGNNVSTQGPGGEITATNQRQVTGTRQSPAFFPPIQRSSMSTTKKHPADDTSLIIPPTGISENDHTICIVSHLHGIPEEDIRIDLEKTRLTISAVIRTGKVLQKVTIPEGSRISKKKFRDGILEIILEKPR